MDIQGVDSGAQNMKPWIKSIIIWSCHVIRTNTGPEIKYTKSNINKWFQPPIKIILMGSDGLDGNNYWVMKIKSTSPFFKIQINYWLYQSPSCVLLQNLTFVAVSVGNLNFRNKNFYQYDTKLCTFATVD